MFRWAARPLLSPLVAVRRLRPTGARSPRRLGECPSCHTSVFDEDDHEYLYRGLAFHAECVGYQRRRR